MATMQPELDSMFSRNFSISLRKLGGNGMTKRDRDDTVEIAWKQAQDCCATPAGRQPPTIDLDVGVGRGGAALTVSVEVSHPCGVISYALNVKVTAGDQTWTWVEGVIVDDKPQTTGKDWGWGTNLPGNLPVQLIEFVTVEAQALSACGTAEIARQRIGLF